MERLSTKLVIPCRNSPEGWEIVLPFYEMSDHYDECMFQTLKCPFFRTGLSCKWEGLASPLRNHIIEKHWLLASKYQTSKDYVMKIPLTGSWYHVMIFGDDVFFRFTRVTNGNVHLCVFYVGPKKMALVFTYTVSIESRKRDRILSMTCVARYYLDDIEGVLASEECCTMNKEFVFKCVNEMMILPVHLKLENCVPKN
ncbi:hypothetical protein C0J52_20430 [Blattella germanica]|nr:hypothetical protein C0J52_20430 [Blattella germanica]